MTVVNIRSPLTGLAAVIEEAAAAVRAKGTVKYHGTGIADLRLSISEADTTFTAPPPAQYPASLQILGDEGVRVRYRAVGNPQRVRQSTVKGRVRSIKPHSQFHSCLVLLT